MKSTNKKERPILFSAPMVRAILEGRKTQTRRIVKPHHVDHVTWMSGDPEDDVPESEFVGLKHGIWRDDEGKERGPEWLLYCTEYPEEGVIPIGQLYGAPGDLLWVRETHAIVPRTAYSMSDGVQQVMHPDNNHDAAVFKEGWERSPPSHWRLSIHMPRWASRILLEVTAIRAERLQDISEADAEAEGARECDLATGREVLLAGPSQRGSYVLHYRDIWEQINGPGSWNANPWVWVVEFRQT